jgi:hypothetical protein
MGCNFRSFPRSVSRRSGSRGRRPRLEAQPGGRVPGLAAGLGQPIQQLTSRARAGHHHHGGPRPGDPLQLLAGAQGRPKILGSSCSCTVIALVKYLFC